MTIERIAGPREPLAAVLRPNRRGSWPEGYITPEMRAVLNSLLSEVEALRRDLRSAQDRLELAERAADRDHLLSLLNRRAFVRELSRHVGLVARYDTISTLLYFDLDGFKRINDAHGHAAGDAVLAHFAEILCVNVRNSDVVGRLGGDEFGVILAHANEAQAEKKAESLMTALTNSPAVWNGRPVAVGFSFGTFRLVAGDDAETSIRRADEAMYAQKRAGCRSTR